MDPSVVAGGGQAYRPGGADQHQRHGAVPVLSGLVVDYFWIISGLFVDTYIYILIVTMVISVISGLNNSHGYSHVIAMCNLNCALRKTMVSVFNMGGIHDLT